MIDLLGNHLNTPIDLFIMHWRSIDAIGEGRCGFNILELQNGWTLWKTGSKDEIYDAKVPGDVHSTLLLARIIPDPFIGQNNEKAKWISDAEWEYETQLNLEPAQSHILNTFEKGGIVHITFDAIDYDAEFYLNKKKITQHIGMFSPVDIIGGIIPNEQESELQMPLRVHFNIQPWWRQHAVKSQMAYGWDFAPEIRTVGIWRPVRIAETGPGFFTELYVIAEPSKSEDPLSLAQIRIQGIVTILDPSSLIQIVDRTSLILHIIWEGNDQTIPITIQSGQPFSFTVTSSVLPLWNPWNLGDSTQIPITIQLWHEQECWDEYHGQILNRQIQWVRNPHTWRKNENWTLEVNGHKMFLRGCNWSPCDSLYGRIDAERYHRLIDLAKDAHIDMFRIWGGGIEEKTEFYEYCDQQGILLWQEFPFACTNYPRDTRYLKIARQECNTIVHRTRNHPSVAVYCGGNEFNPYINAHIVSMVKQLVKEFAPDRHCLSVSPFLGDDHNWMVWGGRKMFDAYSRDNGRLMQFISEFGFQAPPDPETLKIVADQPELGDIASIAENVRYHKGDLSGFEFYAKKFGWKLTDAHQLIQKMQALQAYVYKMVAEKCRSNWPNVSGVFPWQFTDPWPNVSWSIVDYYFRPKKSYQYLQRAYSPILPMIKEWHKSPKGPPWRTGEVVVQNINPNVFTGSLHVEILQHDPQQSRQPPKPLFDIQSGEFQVSPDRPVKVCNLELAAAPGTVVRMHLLNQQGIECANNFAFPAVEPLYSLRHQIIENVNMIWDNWWRTYMIKLMELDRTKRERNDWDQQRAKRMQLNKLN